MSRAAIWVAFVNDEGEFRALGAGSLAACKRRVEREFRRFADREEREELGVPDPLWTTSPTRSYVEQHDAGISYGTVERVPLIEAEAELAKFFRG